MGVEPDVRLLKFEAQIPQFDVCMWDKRIICIKEQEYGLDMSVLRVSVKQETPYVFIDKWNIIEQAWANLDFKVMLWMSYLKRP